MYRLGDKYGVPSLCSLAIARFKDSANTLWTLTTAVKSAFDSKSVYEDGEWTVKFIDSVKSAYSAIPPTDRKMRICTAVAAISNIVHLMELESFQSLLEEEPSFGRDIFRILHQRSKLKDQSCCHCATCNAFDEKLRLPSIRMVRSCKRCTDALEG